MNQENSLIKYRRHFHEHPETSYNEIETSAFIEKELRQMGYDDIRSGIARTGLLAVVKGEIDEYILLRADMDALKLDEATGLLFSSKNAGVMHACGHDGHMAMLLGLAQSVSEMIKLGAKLKRGIKFCFQPAEENGNGAQKMIQEHDILAKVTRCFGFHITSNIPYGEVAYTTGPFTARSERFEVHIIGKGGHAKAPEVTVDALQIGSILINQILQIRGRNINQMHPCALSIGKFEAGEVPNVIPETAHIMGSVRTYSVADSDAIFENIKKLCEGTEIKHGCKVQFNYLSGYRSVVNDPSLKDVVVRAINKINAVYVEKTFGLAGEDFYNFSESRPSAFILIGGGLPDSIQDGKPSKPHHSPFFDFDERALQVGFDLWKQLLVENDVI